MTSQQLAICLKNKCNEILESDIFDTEKLKKFELLKEYVAYVFTANSTSSNISQWGSTDPENFRDQLNGYISQLNIYQLSSDQVRELVSTYNKSYQEVLGPLH